MKLGQWRMVEEQGREEVVVTWLEMRSSHTDRAICMALGLWVTEVALSCIFQEPCRLLAWFTASRNICSCLRVLSTAPMLTILGSQAARAKEQEKSRANVSRCMVLMSLGHSGPGSGLRERDHLAMYGPPGPRAVKHPRILQEPRASAAGAVRGAEAYWALLEHPRGKGEKDSCLDCATGPDAAATAAAAES
jgi:hypothetical protein